MHERIPRRASLGPAPLSYAQERLWFLHQFEPGNIAYNVPVLLEIRGTLDVEALRRALQFIVDRHESLRTTFASGEGIPVQTVQACAIVRVGIYDFCSQSDPQEESRRVLRREFSRPFNLSADLLLRATLVRVGYVHHHLLLTVHHIAFDGWSANILRRELGIAYSAFVTGTNPSLQDLPIQYADYAVWLRQQSESQLLEEHLEFWKKELAGIPADPHLMTDRPRPSQQTYSGGYEVVPVEKELATTLVEFSRRERVTLSMTLFACFASLLYRYTNQEDIIIGMPIANRNWVEQEPLIGFFVNTLAMRCNFAGDPTFRDLLLKVRESSLKAYGHQDLPFEQLVRELRPERNLSHTPIFQTLLAVQNTPRDVPSFEGLTVTQRDFNAEASKFDLIASVELEPQMRVAYTYNRDLFNRGTIVRLAGHFQNVLRAAVQAPETRVSELPMLDVKERQQLMKWKGEVRSYPQQCVHRIFEEVAARTPDAVALVDGSTLINYAQLNARANSLARRLLEAKVKPHARIGLLLKRSTDLIAGMLAILKIGCAYVPIDPDYPRARIDFMVKDCDISVLITASQYGNFVSDPSCVLLMVDRQRDERWAENLELQVTPDDSAYVIYTSGSTGVPKGVEIVHRGIVRLLFAQDYAKFGPEQVMLQLSSLSFDVSTLEVWGPLLHGAPCVLFAGARINAEQVGAAIREHNITTMWLTTSLFNTIVDEAPNVLAPLQQLMVGGEALSAPHIRRALRSLPNTTLINGYGPTENTTFSTCYIIPREIPENQAGISIGRPIANSSAYILDHRRQLVPIGVPGELYVGGDGLACGYVFRPELTAACFLPDPFDDNKEGRIYKTGDFCRWLPDGNIEFLGRSDNQVKIRGFRIELEEIESILRRHPDLCDCVVMAREDSSGSKSLIGYVVLSENCHLVGNDLRLYLRDKLPDYMVPSAFVTMPRLPLTPNGKIDRAALPSPSYEDHQAADEFVGPRTEIEKALAAIWSEVLKVEHLSIHDNFFDLGGHSLLAVKLLARIEQAFKSSLVLFDIFQAPTIAQLAHILPQSNVPRCTSGVVSIRPNGSRPPFFLVRGGPLFLPLARRMDSNQPVFDLHLLPADVINMLAPIRLEAVAGALIAKLHEVQSSGPYYLGGFCSNGLIAYEMASQLSELGQSVALLVLFDSTNPTLNRDLSRASHYDMLLRKLVYHAKKLVHLQRKDLLPYARERLAGIQLRWKYKRWQLAYDLGTPNSDYDLQNLGCVLLPAANSYRPQPYVGSVAFFQSNDDWPVGRYWDFQLGWRDLVRGTFEVYRVPGKHLSMLSESNVNAVANTLSSCLRAAGSRQVAGLEANTMKLVAPMSR